MELVLRDLEKIRIQNITQQTRLFIQSMLDQQAEIARYVCIAKSCSCNIQFFPRVVKTENCQKKCFDSFLIFAQNIDCGYTLEPPRRGGSNEYPQSVFWIKIRKIGLPLHTSVLLYKVEFMGYSLHRMSVRLFQGNILQSCQDGVTTSSSQGTKPQRVIKIITESSYYNV